jgi:hypothetical protein
MDSRLHDLKAFYEILNRLAQKTGGPIMLSNATGRHAWPRRGVYFFFEPGELRTDSGTGMRVVRVGTHALNAGSGTKLWGRLAQHKGQERSGGGNHRGSIFRLIVGTALIKRSGNEHSTWGKGNSAPRAILDQELELEKAVSAVIRAMPFLWLAIEDEPGPQSLRGFIERNALALLSNYKRPSLDSPSATWLGHQCNRERVRESGLWNSNHVDETMDPTFLDTFERLVTAVGEGE